MRYYKARPVDYAPYLVFDCVARSKEEAIKFKIIDDKDTILDGGVMSEIPDTIYGICPKILDDKGQLINRPQKEIEAAKVVFDKVEAEKKIFEKNLSNYQQFKALWKNPTNFRNFKEYYDEISKVHLTYQLTGIFEIEHKGLKAFFDQNKNDKTKQS